MKIKFSCRTAVCFMLVLSFLVSLSCTALADGSKTVYAVDNYGQEYTSYVDAWAAAKANRIITMMCDWVLVSHLNLRTNESAVIRMNGHAIRRNTGFANDGGVLYMYEGSSLSLIGCDSNGTYVKSKLSYTSVDRDCEAETGGLIAGGRSYDCGAGILMKAGASLTLDNVTIGGNVSTLNGVGLPSNRSGAGICMDGDTCSVKMTNHASVEYNFSSGYGGGFYINGKNCTVTLDTNSRIFSNTGDLGGGGIYSNCTGTVITLNGSSAIDSNIARQSGGGIFLDDTSFTVTSTDSTGRIINNWSNEIDGAGIYADAVSSAMSGTISNLQMWNNRACGDGGAIFLNQEKVTVKNCKITDSVVGSEGGGIYIDNDQCVIEDCTITGNKASTAGGGIFASSNNCFALRGTVYVAGNARISGLQDNVYLNYTNLFLSDYSSLFTGAPSSDSWIGVRANVSDSNRQIGKNATYPANAFFSDDPSWHIEASGSELWLKKGTRYNLTVNGKHVGSFAEGETAAVSSTPDFSRVFRCWNNAPDVVYSDRYAEITTITMPAHDTAVTATYVDKIQSVTLTVDAPTAGQELPASGVLSWKSADGSSTSRTNVSVLWLETVDGLEQIASGKAGYGRQYSVAAVIAQNLPGNMAFYPNATASIQYGSGAAEAATTEVDDTGALHILGNPISTIPAKVTGVGALSVSVTKDSSLETLRASLPRTVILETEDGTKTANLLTDGALENVDLSGPSTFTVQAGIDYTGLNLDPAGHTTAEISVTVTALDVLVSPAISLASGTYTQADTDCVTKNDTDQSISMDITLRSADPHAATLSYTLITSYDSAVGRESFATPGTYDGTPIRLSAAHGYRVTYILSVYARGSGYSDSAPVTRIYVLDNPFTVTVRGVDTGTKTGEAAADELYTPKTYTYRYGSSVVIGAVSVDGEIFERWDDVTGIANLSGSDTDATLRISPLTQDIELTAVYNPVIREIHLTMDAPETGYALPTGVSCARAVCDAYAAPYDAASLLGSITWTPGDDTAAGGTSYMARIPVDTSGYARSGQKIRLSENLSIDVQDTAGRSVAASAVAQLDPGGQFSLYIAFPETQIIETDEPVTPDTPDEPEPVTPVPVPSSPDTTEDEEEPDSPEEPVEPENPFIDIEPDDWYYDDVLYALDSGLMNGTRAELFEPELTTTRGMIVTVLYRLCGEPEVSGEAPFSDCVQGSYYESAVLWAASEGIVLGYSDGRFGPDDPITREQLAAILWRYAKAQGMDVSVGEDTNIMDYDDVREISPYAVSALQWAVGAGLMQGSGWKLEPRKDASRAQVAAILHRFRELVR